MGKPGGFFKRLHSKVKRKASRQQRGTKGASKEERRRKRQEQAVYYAAKREAERLAAVSSSDEDVDALSTDSDDVRECRMKGVKRLRSVLGVKNPSSMRSKKKGNNTQGITEEALMEDEKADGQNSLLNEKKGHAKPHDHQSRRLFEEEENEDWRDFIGDEESEEEEEEGEGLLADWGEDEEKEKEDEENAVENPLFLLAENEDATGAENDIFDEVLEFDEPVEEGEEEDLEDMEEEEEEEDHEDIYVDEDEEVEEDERMHAHRSQKDPLSRETKENEEDPTSLLLPRFRWGSSSARTLERSGVVNEKDPWYRKFHLNAPPPTSASPSLDSSSQPQTTAMQQMELDSLAKEALAHSYEPYMRKAELEFNAKLLRKEHRLPSFVRKEDYAKLKPSNVVLDMTPTAALGLLHPPFHPMTASTTSEELIRREEPRASVADVGTVGSHSTMNGDKSHSEGASLESLVEKEIPPYLHPELWKKWRTYREQRRGLPAFTVEERGILDLLQAYPDLLDTTRQWQKAESRRDIFVLHLLNHWFKAKSVVLAHDKMLREWKQKKDDSTQCGSQKSKKKSKKNKDSDNGKEEEEGGDLEEEEKVKAENRKKKEKDTAESRKYPEKCAKKGMSEKKKANGNEDEEEAQVPDLDDYELRDRGFTKTRLLLVLPLRNHAYHYLKTFMEILGANPNECSKWGTFEEDFTEIEEGMDPTFRRRPRDYQREFEGNIDDNFCVGVKLFPGKLDVYAHPLNSDIIIASPLGLRRRIEKNGDALISLSSVEVCVVDEAQMLLEQNWAHVAVLLEELLNQRPTDTTRGLSDLRRTYSWVLGNESGSHRQTVISSDVCSASVLSTFRAMPNSWGKIRLYHKHEEGVLTHVKVPVQQHFMRYTPQSLATSDEERLEYFTKHIFTSRLNPLAERDVRIIIYVPSYFDFVRLRTYLYKEYRDTFAAISEYSSLKQQRKALGQFSDLERPVLLVTERFYYFKRYFVSMSEVVVFYSPPLIPSFYLSFVNRLVAESPNVFSLCVFCRYDVHELVRIVGTQKAQQLLQRESSVYSFVTN